MTRPPDRLVADGLSIRRWRTDDAPALHDALEASVEHLRPWIPWAVAQPAPVAELEVRLAGYASDFDADRGWLYAVRASDDGALLGGVGLYPRVAERRVPMSQADRVEIGYWLHVDAGGRGVATAAAGAALAAALALPGLVSVEIRCDPRNGPSAAVPRRLGFRLARTIPAPPDAPGGAGETMVWEFPIPAHSSPAVPR